MYRAALAQHNHGVNMKPIAIILAWILMTVSCSVVSKSIRDKAISPPSFGQLADDIGLYRNQTVILGGHVLSVHNHSDGSVIKALQVPLKAGDKPGSKDHSEGRLEIHTTQFIDPEVYTKGRKLTVAGKIISSTREKDKTAGIPHVVLNAEELHLWPQYTHPRYRYPYDDPYWYWNGPWYGRHAPFHAFHHHGLWYRHRHYRHD